MLDVAKGAISELISDGVIEWDGSEQEFCPTALGIATSVSGIDSKEAHHSYGILKHAIQNGLTLS